MGSDEEQLESDKSDQPSEGVSRNPSIKKDDNQTKDVIRNDKKDSLTNYSVTSHKGTSTAFLTAPMRPGTKDSQAGSTFSFSASKNIFEDEPERKFDSNEGVKIEEDLPDVKVNKDIFFTVEAVRPSSNVTPGNLSTNKESKSSEQDLNIEISRTVSKSPNMHVGSEKDFTKEVSPFTSNTGEQSNNLKVTFSEEEIGTEEPMNNDINEPMMEEKPESNIAQDADSSFLSPVDDHDENLSDFNMNKRNDEFNDAWNYSEAETEIIDSPPRIKSARKFYNTKSFTNNQKRKSVIESSDEDISKRLSSSVSKAKAKPYKIKRDSSGRSLLQRACKKGSIEDVKRYIENGASPNEADFCGFTCLHEAALEGHSQIVEFLIEHGADVNKQALPAGDLETALIDAAENKHYNIVKILLENGADPRIFNIDGFTALTKTLNNHADEEGYEDIIALLEEYHSRFAEINDDLSSIKRGRKFSPSPKVVEDPSDVYFSDLLKKRGMASYVYKYAAEGAKEETANYFIEGGSLDLKPDILFLAARNGHKELVEIILGLNPTRFDINEENDCGTTPLLASVGRGHLEMVQFLLEKGANPGLRRRQDGLNAVELSQRSLYYNPKEEELLQKYLELPKTSSSSRTVKELDAKEQKEDDNDPEQGIFKKDYGELPFSSQTPNLNADVSSSKVNGKARTSSSAHSAQSEKKHKKLRIKEVEVKIKPHPSGFFNGTVAEGTKSLIEKVTSNHSETDKQSESNQFSVKRSVSGSLSPSSFSTLSEEKKTKSAEDAKIWQEKVEAKKRARRDMFLKQEKEKEKKKKKDEERKKELEKLSEIKAKEEEVKQEEITRQKDKEIAEKKRKAIHRLILEHIPAGLRSYSSQGVLAEGQMNSFLPFYTFIIGNKEYISDLQLSLLTGTSTVNITKELPKSSYFEANEDQKSKLWTLFCGMIGRASRLSSVTRKSASEGHSKFQYLIVNFIELDSCIEMIKEEYPQVYSIAWANDNNSRVDIDSLRSFSEEVSTEHEHDINGTETEVNFSTPRDSKYIPLSLKLRKDALRTIKNTQIPFW